MDIRVSNGVLRKPSKRVPLMATKRIVAIAAVYLYGGTYGVPWGILMECHGDTHAVPWRYSWNAMGILVECHGDTNGIPRGYS